MILEDDLQNALLFLADCPIWIFSIGSDSNSLCSLYKCDSLPAFLTNTITALSLTDLKEALKQIISPEEEYKLLTLFSMQTRFSELLPDANKSLQFKVRDCKEAQISFRIRYIDEQLTIVALYYYETPTTLSEYLF